MMKKVLFILLIVCLATACWPTSISFRDGSVPPEWKRFVVQTLENKAPNAPLNYSSVLTEEIKDAVQNRVGLTLVGSENDDPQIVITGIVSSYRITPLSLQDNTAQVKNRLTVQTQFKLFISAPEEKLMEVHSSQFADFDASQNIGAIRNQLMEEINEKIVQDVLNKLLSNW